MNTVFKELGFLGLREQDKINPAHVISESVLRGQYAFADFYKIDNDEGAYGIDDLYFKARIQEANNKNIKSHQTSWHEDRSRFDPVTRHFSHESSTHTFLTDSDGVTKKPKGELLSRMKSWIKEKNETYENLFSHYNKLANEYKNVKLLPMSFYRQKNSLAPQSLFDDIKELVTAFNDMINILKGRQLYSTFVSYSRVILLDENQTPYLHIIFYYQAEAMSDFFIRDMTREWCKACRQDVHIDYMAFGSLFTEMRNDDEEAEWKQGVCRDKENILHHLSASARHALFPFFGIRNSIQLIPISEHHQTRQAKLDKIPLSLLSRHAIELSYYQEKEFASFVNGVKQHKKYHLYYLEQVAKQYTKIPTVNNMTHAMFTYKNKKKENDNII